MNREKAKLERQREKLLQAHYAGAIPLDLLKAEQDKIAKAVLSIGRRLEAHSTEHGNIETNLHTALNLMEGQWADVQERSRLH